MGGRPNDAAAPAHDRQRAHRPGVAVAVAGGLPGGARHVPVRGRAAGRVPRLRLHLRLVALLRLGRGERPRALRKISERVAEGRFQVVGGWWIEPDCNIPSGESLRATGALRPALPARALRRSRRRPARTSTRSGTTRRSRRSCAKSGCDSYVFLRPGPRRRRSRARSSGGSRPTGRACSRTGSRTSTARRRTTSASTSSRRSRHCRTTARSTRSSTASATTAAARRSRTSSRSGR